MAEPVTGRWEDFHARLKGKTRQEFNARNRNMIEPAVSEVPAKTERDKPGTSQVVNKGYSLDGGPRPPWMVYNKMARINHRDAQSRDRRAARLATAARKEQIKEAQKAQFYGQNAPENGTPERE